MSMDDDVSTGVLDVIRRRLLPRRHTALLIAIVAAFVVRPMIGDAGIAPLLFSIALLVLLLVALYTIQVDESVGKSQALVVQKRRRGMIGWVLALLAVGERLAAAFSEHEVTAAGSVPWLLFIIYVTWNELRSVLRQKEVTGETIAMSISIYLLLGLSWGFFYILLFQLQPNAFSFGSTPLPVATGPNRFQTIAPVLVYFSLTTLATIGYGDITPLTLQARYAAVAEGITGQFYLAILVARLVGLQMSQSSGR